MIYHSEVNAMQDLKTGLWTVWLYEWHDNNAVAQITDIARDIKHEEVEKYLAWGNLQK